MLHLQNFPSWIQGHHSASKHKVERERETEIDRERERDRDLRERERDQAKQSNAATIHHRITYYDGEP